MTTKSEIEEVNARRNWDVILSQHSGLSNRKHLARILGASDIPAIMGLAPFKKARGPLDVYLDFYGLRKRDPPSDAMRRGTALEPMIAQTYADTTGRPLLTVNETQVHPELPFLTVHIDRAVKDPKLLVEIKYVGWRVAHHWDNGVPAYVVAQVTAQMLTWGVNRADVAADIGENFHAFELELDPKVGEIILEQVDIFWRRHIVPMVPPDQPGSDAARDFLLHRFPKAGPKILPANDSAWLFAQELQKKKEILAKAEVDLEKTRQWFMDLIGDGKGFEGDGWKAQWYDVKGRSNTDWKAVKRTLIERKLLSGEALETVIANHTTIGEPSRSFRFDSKE